LKSGVRRPLRAITAAQLVRVHLFDTRRAMIRLVHTFRLRAVYSSVAASSGWLIQCVEKDLAQRDFHLRVYNFFPFSSSSSSVVSVVGLPVELPFPY